MRAFRLAQAAWEAELLRLRYQARRTARRLVLGGIAMMFLGGALAFGHLAAWYWLRQSLPAHQAALVVAGADLLLAALLALFVLRSRPGTVEREALTLRRRALVDARRSLGVVTLLTRLLEFLIASRR